MLRPRSRWNISSRVSRYSLEKVRADVGTFELDVLVVGSRHPDLDALEGARLRKGLGPQVHATLLHVDTNRDFLFFPVVVVVVVVVVLVFVVFVFVVFVFVVVLVVVVIVVVILVVVVIVVVVFVVVVIVVVFVLVAMPVGVSTGREPVVRVEAADPEMPIEPRSPKNRVKPKRPLSVMRSVFGTIPKVFSSSWSSSWSSSS